VQIKSAGAESICSGVVAFNSNQLFLAALRAARRVGAAFRTGCMVATATTVALHGGLAAGFIFAARAAGGQQDSCGKNRSQDHH